MDTPVNEGTKALAFLERIASAVEFMAAQTGHVPNTPAQSIAESVQIDAANTEKASEGTAQKGTAQKI